MKFNEVKKARHGPEVTLCHGPRICPSFKKTKQNKNHCARGEGFHGPTAVLTTLGTTVLCGHSGEWASTGKMKRAQTGGNGDTGDICVNALSQPRT